MVWGKEPFHDAQEICPAPTPGAQHASSCRWLGIPRGLEGQSSLVEEPQSGDICMRGHWDWDHSAGFAPGLFFFHVHGGQIEGWIHSLDNFTPYHTFWKDDILAMDLFNWQFLSPQHTLLYHLSNNKLIRKYENDQPAERTSRPESPLNGTVFDKNKFPFSTLLFELLKPSSAGSAWCKSPQASGILAEGASPHLETWDPEAEGSQLPSLHVPENLSIEGTSDSLNVS